MIKLNSQEKARKSALDQIYEVSFLGIGGHFIIVLVVAFLFLNVIPFSIILMGVGIHSFILVMRAYSAWYYFKIQTSINTSREISRWTKYYAIGAFLTGAAWGFSFLLFAYDQPPEYPFFLYAVILGLASAGIATLGTILSIYLSFILPMLTLFSLWLLFLDGQSYVIATPLLFVVLGFNYFSARRYSANFNKAIMEKESAIQTKYEIIKRLSHASELKDNETGMHIVRMSYYAFLLAKQSGQDEKFSGDILYASAMHDVGKIGIPDHILLKNGKLDGEEWDTMKGHTTIGKMILEGSESKLIQLSERIAYSHHEKYDGSGYPNGLKGEEIPIEARITAIADVFDALVSDRPYKKKWSNDEAFAFIQEQAGIHFDPELVKHFIKLAPKIAPFQRSHKDKE